MGVTLTHNRRNFPVTSERMFSIRKEVGMGAIGFDGNVRLPLCFLLNKVSPLKRSVTSEYYGSDFGNTS